jgi:Cu(I)/Ag(I) efflux system membrane fusion protein
MQRINGVFVLIGIAVSIGIGFYLGQSRSFSAHTSPDKQTFVQCAEEEAKTYTCSMHPQVERAMAGQCPGCGMKLIEKHLLPHNNPDLVALTDADFTLAGGATRVVEQQGVDHTVIPVMGRLEIPPGNIRKQVAGLPGRIEELYVTAPGTYVKKGQPIAAIYSKDLIAVVEAFVYNTNSESILRAAKNNLKSWNLDLDVLQQFDVASGQYRKPVVIHADFEGYVLEHFTQTGAYTANAHMGAPTTLYTVAILDQLWASFELYESDLSGVKKGSKVFFTTEAYPGERFGGRVTFISPVVNPESRTVEVRVELSNPGHRLKPDMLVEGTLKSSTGRKDGQLAIPRTAVLWTGKRSLVYVRDTNFDLPVFKPRTVILGDLSGEQYTILEGLKPGETIAVNGVFAIDAAAQLSGSRSMMSVGSAPVLPVAARHSSDSE